MPLLYYFKYGLTSISIMVDYDVIVAGGGLTGTIAAQAIAHYSNQNLKILSIDRNPEIYPGRKIFVWLDMWRCMFKRSS